MKGKLLFLKFYLGCNIFFYAQNKNSGLILPIDKQVIHSEKYCCVLSPSNGFSVYDESEKKIGVIKMKNRSENEQNKYSIFFINSKLNLEYTDIDEIGYELYSLSFVNQKNGYLKLKGKQNYWFKIDDIKKNQFKPIAWIDFLLDNSDEVLGYYAKDPGLNIRKEPNNQSEIIGSVKGDLFQLKLSKTIAGNWCRVEIIKYREHPCETNLEEKDNIELRYSGWAKIIDDSGMPNIWNYTRGC